MRRPTAFFGAAIIAGSALLAGVAMPVEAVAATSNQNLENYQVLAPPSVITSGSANQAESDNLVSFQRNYGYAENGDPKTTPAPLKVTTDWENKNNEPVSMHGVRQSLYESQEGALVTGKNQHDSGWTDEEVIAKCNQYNDQSGPFGWFAAVNDFFQEAATDYLGAPCAAYELEPVEDYTPETALSPAPAGACATTACGYPFEVNAGVTAKIKYHVPEWSNKEVTGTDGVKRREGWLVPIEILAKGIRDGAEVQSYAIYAQLGWNNATGGNTPYGSPHQLVVASTERQDIGHNPNCAVKVTWCVSLAQSTAYTATQFPETAYRWRANSYFTGGGANDGWKDKNGTPYIDIRLANPPTVGAPQSQVVNNVTNNYYTNGETATCKTRAYRETEPNTPVPCQPDAPDDWVLDRTENYQQTPDGSWTGQKQEAVTTPEYQEWKTENPECAKTVCVLDLVLVGTGSCFNLGDTCDGWASDPDKGTKYQCLYGTKDVGLLECELYSRTFNQANRDGGFAYGTDIIPVSSVTTPPSGQPTEPPPGADGDTPTPTPTPTPGGTSSPTPTPGYTPPPGEGGTQGGHADPNGDGADGCWPTGWAMFNPVEWVLKPIRCAFEPDPQVVEDSFREMEEKFTESSMWGVLDGLNGATSLLLTPGGCTGPEVRLPLITYEYVGYPLSACEEPLAGFAAIARVFTMIGAWVACLVSVSSSIGGIVGFNGLRGNGDGK